MSLPQLPDLIPTTRLRLPLISPAQAADLSAGSRHPSFAPGFPSPHDLAAVGMVRDTDPEAMSWGPRLVIRAHDGLVCGTIGFFGPPDPEEAEVGFGLVEGARGHGVATEALLAVLSEADRCGVKVRARVEPSNTASLKVLSKTGFTELRGGDEDGNLVMGRPGGGPR